MSPLRECVGDGRYVTAHESILSMNAKTATVVDTYLPVIISYPILPYQHLMPIRDAASLAPWHVISISPHEIFRGVGADLGTVPRYLQETQGS